MSRGEPLAHALFSLRSLADPTSPVLRLYRGMGPPIVGVSPIFALSFWSYDLGKKLALSFGGAAHSGRKELSLTELAFAGFFSAVPTTLVAGPAERVKVLLQVSSRCAERATSREAV